MRLTAEDAKAIADARLDRAVDALLSAIETAAEAGKRKLYAGADYEDYPDIWVTGGNTLSKDWTQARETLSGLGYDVSFCAVNNYTLIEW